MSLSKYRAFVKIAQTGSLTSAARQLGYSQPAVSHMIESLEREFGFPLFIRNRDGILLTENGKQVLDACCQIINDENALQETISSINGLLSGTIHLGAYTSMMLGFLPRAIRSFSDIYPSIQIHLQELLLSGLQDSLIRGSIDLAFMVNLAPKGFTFLPLIRDRICVIMREDHPFASYEKVPPSLLNGCSFIKFGPEFDDYFDASLKNAPFSPSIRYYVTSDVAAMSLVSDGLGISVSSSLLQDILPRNVVARELEGGFGRNLGIAVKSLRQAPPAVRELIRISKKAAQQMDSRHLTVL
ncbi:DNA-binding transcriptional regulator, LysR family [Oscillibacter sp. PC13]|uniref:LysR family transcriptional regulator n=1 Tax=Oscillibacter sp. PC13 TaxID=1855299 RepID=UPI0008E358DA|nr:LysR family transcriptional regulator [Oscillibacter sp. PC13]SFP15176.1 DNA-binding transcriptional regulator, LysR family [Oscillibacter sp. PC13]